MGPVLPKGQSQYVHLSDRCASVAVTAAQHMMCQVLYIGRVRKRLIKEKGYSSACNISASLSGSTPHTHTKRHCFKNKVTLGGDWNPRRKARGTAWYIRCRSVTDLSCHSFIIQDNSGNYLDLTFSVKITQTIFYKWWKTPTSLSMLCSEGVSARWSPLCWITLLCGKATIPPPEGMKKLILIESIQGVGI